MLRAYEHGKPAKTPNYLKINFAGTARRRIGVRLRPSRHDVAPGDPAQLEFERDMLLPTTLLRTSELRGGYIQFGRTIRRMSNWSRRRSTVSRTASRFDASCSMHCTTTTLMARKKSEESACARARRLAGTDPWQQIESASAPRTRALFAVQLHRGRRRIQQHSVPLRTAAAARGRRTGETQYRAAARVHRRSAAAHRAAALRAVPIYAEVEIADAVLLAAAHARVARAGLSARTQLAHQGFARHARDAARGRDQARRRRGTQSSCGKAAKPPSMRRGIP